MSPSWIAKQSSGGLRPIPLTHCIRKLAVHNYSQILTTNFHCIFRNTALNWEDKSLIEHAPGRVVMGGGYIGGLKPRTEYYLNVNIFTKFFAL